jgi:hypothetical protein
MRSFASLAGTDLQWTVDLDPLSMPAASDRHYVLFAATEPVASTQASWQQRRSYSLAQESSEGTYFTHVDLTSPSLQSVTWKAGNKTSTAGFVITAPHYYDPPSGDITTALGRHLVVRGVGSGIREWDLPLAHWQATTRYPSNPLSFNYVVADLSGQVLIFMAPAHRPQSHLENLILVAPGKMSINPLAAPDPELPALVALCFALVNQYAMHLTALRLL